MKNEKGICVNILDLPKVEKAGFDFVELSVMKAYWHIAGAPLYSALPNTNTYWATLNL